MHCVYHPIYSQLVLPARHRYPISKYGRLHQALHQQGWLPPELEHQPSPVTLEQLSQVHCPDYIEAFCSDQLPSRAMRRIGFPWSDTLVQRTLLSCGGSYLTAQLALEHGRACHLSGGYHHAHRDFGSGFCVFNDLVLAARLMQQHHGVERVLIFDCDVHQGDGSAALALGDDSLITVSLHCQNNFPARKQPSDVDIPLDPGIDDAHYLATLDQVLPWVLDLYRPDLVIYDAGVDIHGDDALGHLAVTTEGLRRRDRRVFHACQQRQIPLAAVIGGGYADRHQDLTERHLQLFAAGREVD
ncbi:histone deacetylase family protein [Ferrimonas marina]|uniref:Acetoin utilization deacetylase AcuC n=1 Tax=Ferrimonas marina TaxID=299255 RepID=A0A1M5RPF3_9GAMM|nr:histone deacetylase [Ferrimonas marina]SHH28217.1 Acetoin utilization deacetylase AcuC [Ferrimonas marina]